MAIASQKLQDSGWQILVDGSSGTAAIVERVRGTITNGDIPMSRLVTDVPTDGVPDSPGGCTVRTT